MKVIVVLLCALLVVHDALAASQPQLSETFLAPVSLMVEDKNGNYTGKGYWAQDVAQGSSVEFFDFGSSRLDYTLQRWDLGTQYAMDDKGCKQFKLEGNMPLVWGWIANSTFKGTTTFRGMSVDVWQFAIGYAELSIAVSSSNTATPVYLMRHAPEINTTLVFLNWDTTISNTSVFDIPKSCNNNKPLIQAETNSSVGCIDGSTIVANAKVWVNNKVPYNQGADYMGYREDCSGYVSYCWGSSKPGHTTQTIPQIATQISKADLKVGDCLLYAAEHVVLFGGWLDSAQTQYQAYEETKPGEGTVTRATPYPYWYSQSMFLPYRYNSIC